MFRRVVAAVWFVLLLLGQQAAALHAVAHAAERLDGSAPAKACEQCFLGAQLSSPLGTSLPELPAPVPESAPSVAIVEPPALADAPVYFRSRAPPRLS